MEILVGRVSLLTELALHHGIPIPAMDEHEERLITQACENLELDISRVMPPSLQDAVMAPAHASGGIVSNDPITDPPISQQQGAMSADFLMDPDPSAQNALEAQNWVDFSSSEPWERSPADWSWQMLNDFSGLSSFNYALTAETFMIDPSAPANETRNDVRNESASSSDEEAENDIVPGLAARLGSLCVANDGRLRYYGTASNVHFLTSSSLNRGSVFDVQEMQKNASVALENAHLDQDIPTALRDHFIELFFQWHNPAHTTIDRPLFEAALPQHGDGQGEWCSQSLVAVM